MKASDHISGGALLSGLLEMEDGDQSLPFSKLIHSDASSYIREDDEGHAHCIKQGDKRAGQMHLCSSSVVWNNARLSARLRDSLAGEKLLAFSETCTSVANHAAVEMHNTVRRELWLDAKIRSCGRGFS